MFSEFSWKSGLNGTWFRCKEKFILRYGLKFVLLLKFIEIKIVFNLEAKIKLELSKRGLNYLETI